MAHKIKTVLTYIWLEVFKFVRGLAHPEERLTLAHVHQTVAPLPFLPTLVRSDVASETANLV